MHLRKTNYVPLLVFNMYRSDTGIVLLDTQDIPYMNTVHTYIHTYILYILTYIVIHIFIQG